MTSMAPKVKKVKTVKKNAIKQVVDDVKDSVEVDSDFDSDVDLSVQGRANEDSYCRPQIVKFFYESDNDNSIVKEPMEESDEDIYIRVYDSDDNVKN